MSATPVTPHPRREDILVSVCIPDCPPDADARDAIRALAERLDARYRFREILLIVDERDHEAYLPLVTDVGEVRLFAVPRATGHYERRAIAATEAIGDVTLIAHHAELAAIDAVGMIEEAARSEQAVRVRRPRESVVMAGLAAPLVGLGRAAGFNVDLRDLQSVAVPRTMLNKLLGHPQPDLALRFLPRDPGLAERHLAPGQPLRGGGDSARMGRRLQLLQKLLVYSAPSLLLLVTLSSALLTLLGLASALYTVFVFFTVDDIAPGWITTSSMLSFTAIFLGVAILGLSLGLQRLFSQLGNAGFADRAFEINRVDLFGKVAGDLNVDIATGAETRRDDR